MRDYPNLLPMRFLATLLCPIGLVSCASSVPSNFQYETSLRNQQGFIGQANRMSGAESLLNAGVVTDPLLALTAALPDADIKVRNWGLRYFGSNWSRYQVALDVDIEQDDKKTKCREVSTDTPVGAPTLNALLANDGLEFQRQLERLVADCVVQSKDLT